MYTEQFAQKSLPVQHRTIGFSFNFFLLANLELGNRDAAILSSCLKPYLYHDYLIQWHREFKLSLNPFPNEPWFLGVCSISLLKTLFRCLQYTSFENTLGKGEIARKEQFLLFPKCFQSVSYMFGHLFAIFIKLKIVVCRLFQFGIV